MNSKTETVKVLILHESRDEAEHLLNLIRNAGRAARGQLLDSSETLLECLGNSAWDLMLLRPETDDLNAQDCVMHVRRQSRDIPAILLVDSHNPEDIVENLREGFVDVIPVGERERLQMVISRELANLGERRLRRHAELALKEAEKRCAALLATSRDAITYVTDGMLTYANQAFQDLFGYDDPDELEGTPIMDMVSPDYHEALKHFLRIYAGGDSKTNEFTCKGICTDGSEIHCSMVFSAATYDGEPCTQIMIRTNQADAQLQERLKEISSQDLLTGLFNRNHFIQLLEQAAEWTVRESKSAALLYMHLDNFDDIKSDVGIGGADIVLGDVASLLRNIMPHATLSRFADEIFTAIVDEANLTDGHDTAERTRATIEDHLFAVNERTVRTTVSIGVTLISEASSNVHDALNQAHLASERVRSSPKGGNGIEVYDPTAERRKGMDVGAKVQDAIDRGLFKILFQPVMDLRGGGGELYEVFMRMVDENGKNVSPSEFLGHAQVQEMREKIDRWVILQSIKSLADHRANGHNTKLLINVTAESLRDQTLLPWLSVAIKAARMPADALIFQFSEQDATTYLRQAKEFTRGLKELHCNISISRFGCSLNPFNTLKHLEVDFLKLDGSFTKDLGLPEQRENLKEIVTTAHSMGKLTIASFVESASVLSSLWQIGVNFIQGYYLQAPTEQMDYDFNAE
jgi:diguanylate cyclase (GGDEF)-like protein/PAS domain S-box-containing protein